MTIDEKLRNFVSVFAELQASVEPLKKVTKLLEEEIGNEKEELRNASQAVEEQLEGLQNGCVEKITKARTDTEVAQILKEFEEAFYNAALDYWNGLISLIERC